MNNTLPEDIQQLIDETVDRFNQIFGVDNIKPSVHLVASRAEMDQIKQSSTQSWLVGFVQNGGIYILDKNKFETDSSHPKSNFEGVLQHEIAHLYIAEAMGNKKPNWLNEGLAAYLAGQIKPKPADEKIFELRYYYDHFDTTGYQLGNFWVTFLVDKFGLSKLIDFLHKWWEVEHTSEEFEKVFETEYGFNLSKEQLENQLKINS